MSPRQTSVLIAACLGVVVMLASPAAASAAASAAAGTPPNQADAVGKPFQVSDSVKAYCAMKPGPVMCESFAPQLAEFLAESRDAQWAAPVERLIVKSMLAGGKPWMKIRALECRHTLCALEYAVNATVTDLDHDADGDETLDRLMEPIGGVIAPEVSSAAGGGMIVTVLIWRKR